MQTFHRTATCGEARAELAGQAMTLAGWVHRRRDLGQLIFLDLRDRYGITQVVLDRATAPAAHAVASEVRPEFVIRASGLLAKRLPGTENARLATGEVELRADGSTSCRRRARRRSTSTSPRPRSTRRCV